MFIARLAQTYRFVNEQNLKCSLIKIFDYEKKLQVSSIFSLLGFVLLSDGRKKSEHDRKGDCDFSESQGTLRLQKTAGCSRTTETEIGGCRTGIALSMPTRN